MIWKVALISGVSAPCIWNDRIFLTGFDEENKKLRVLCRQRADGKLIWDRAVPAKEIEPYHITGTSANATPTTDGQKIYVHSGSYGLQGRVYLIKNGDIVCSLESLTGKLHYRTRLNASGPYFSSSVAANVRI